MILADNAPLSEPQLRELPRLSVAYPRHSTDLMRQLEITLSGGAHDRVAVAGVPALYNALVRGPDDSGRNPVFYISRSGWNLHDLLQEFMRQNDLPAGPMFLTDLQVFDDSSEVLGSSRHKWQNIDLLMRTYPEYRFVLIGDSGMHDPELYREVVERHPGRVRAIYMTQPGPTGRRGRPDCGRIGREGRSHAPHAGCGGGRRSRVRRGPDQSDGLDQVRAALRRQPQDH